jgi:hypothetical protein
MAFGTSNQKPDWKFLSIYHLARIPRLQTLRK